MTRRHREVELDQDQLTEGNKKNINITSAGNAEQSILIVASSCNASWSFVVVEMLAARMAGTVSRFGGLT